MRVFAILKTFGKILILFILQLFCIQPNTFAQDSLSVKHNVKQKFFPQTMKATMLAVVFPGLGQVYNRKYWKVPIVYAGFGGLFYAAGFNSRNYKMYLEAYRDFTDNVKETNSYVNLPGLRNIDQKTYDPVCYPDSKNTTLQSNYKYYKDGMLRMVDYHKRYRDLSYIGIAGWYLLSILDANVDASLFNYDVTDNLDIAIAPAGFNMPGGLTYAGLNVNMKITF